MPEQQKVVIVFPDTWLSFSPTLINLAEILAKQWRVIIITTGEERFIDGTFRDTANVDVRFRDVRSKLMRNLIRRFDTLMISLITWVLKAFRIYTAKNIEFWIGYNLENLINVLRFRKEARKVFSSGDILIGVDNIGMLSVRGLDSHYHVISLEIAKSMFYSTASWKNVKSLIIQTEERKEYWVPQAYKNVTTYFVQNAPILGDQPVLADLTENGSIIYMGNLALEYNALHRIADSIRLLPDRYSVVLKGIFNEKTDSYLHENYPELINSGRLKLDYEYVQNADLPEFLRRFAFGISLYDMSVLFYRSFNVLSCPSGKLFNYYNSAIPVIGNDILGLKSISDFHAGRIISEISGKSIADAVLEIADNYEYYRSGARAAAVSFDFRTSSQVFIERELLNI